MHWAASRIEYASFGRGGRLAAADSESMTFVMVPDYGQKLSFGNAVDLLLEQKNAEESHVFIGFGVGKISSGFPCSMLPKPPSLLSLQLS